MTFHEVRFPTDISLGASGGPMRRTDIVTLGSGHEERNTPWAHSRRRYNAGYGVKSLNDLHDVIAFFEARMGRLYGFRWKDKSDFRSSAPQTAVAPTDQYVGTGDGSTAGFQLIKTYTSGSANYVRVISKPVQNTVRVAADGVELAQGMDFSLDTTTGLATFLPGKIPASGAYITAGFEFDVPVRFDTDYLNIDHTAFHAGDIPNIPIIEILT